MNIYQQQILDNYHNPMNFGKPSEEIYDFSLRLENLSCGDEIEIFLVIDRDTHEFDSDYLDADENTVKSAYFDGRGCAISIASASLLTEKLKGMKIGAIKDMEVQDVLDLLGIELTTSRLKCATLPLDAARMALLKRSTNEKVLTTGS